MNHANYHIHFGADRHPTLELLRQYQEGLLSPALSHQLEHHLLDCDLCADIAEGMALSDATQTKVAVADINQRLTIANEKRRAVTTWYADWRAVAAVFVLLCSAVMVVYYQYSNLQIAPETIAVEQTETIVQEPEPTINYAPPIAKLDEEVAEDAKPAQPIVRPRLGTAKTIAAADPIDELLADDEVILDEKNLAKIADAEKTEAVALGDVTFDLKADSAATIATVQPKAKVATPAPQMSFDRALEGKVAGVNVQRRADASKVIQGRVTDKAGNPLPGVAVTYKGTMQGIATDANGNFTLPLSEDKKVLSFRYIGFQSLEQTIDSNTTALAINLEPDTRQLSEVVVTGYGRSAAAPVIKNPEPTIGRRAYKLYLKNEQRPLKATAKGRVIVGFTVSETGQPENVQVLRNLNPEADAEAIRLIQQGPAWEPAMQNGNPVAQEVKVVVRFR